MTLRLDRPPRAGCETELVEVVEPLGPIVTPEEVQTTFVLDDAVVLPHTRRRAAVLDTAPDLGVEVKLVKIVESSAPTVAPEHEHAVSDDDARCS